MRGVNASLDAISAFILKSLFSLFYLLNEQVAHRFRGDWLCHHHEGYCPGKFCLLRVFWLFRRYLQAVLSGCPQVKVCLLSLLALSYRNNNSVRDFV
jgi:hypothetical protein